MVSVRRALLSVSDKHGLAELATALAARGVEILSTGGTERHLEAAGVAVTPVSRVTGSPEILDGRVKTLHPRIHGGILADRRRPEHLAQLAEHGIGAIDLVVVNLYPFAATVARPDATAEDIVENIDIGGPAMVRAAAKNHGSVAVVVDPADYPRLLEALDQHAGALPAALCRELAAKAFAHTAGYDTAVARWFREGSQEVPGDSGNHLTVELERVLVPRYGENPHQAAAVYATVVDGHEGGVFGGFAALQGKELSWNNLLDADAARKMAAELASPGVVIVKHNNPCGVGVGEDLVSAYQRALATDPVSAFGSILAVNRPVTGALAEALADLFVEVLVAPAFTPEARERFAAKTNLRLLECPLYRPNRGEWELRAIDGGFLAQTADSAADDPAGWSCPTQRVPTDAERAAAALAWQVARYTKSNAIVIANPVQTVGIGAGQMSRVDSCRLAVEKARLPLAGTAAASDAFFPFRDGLDVLAAAGVKTIVHPGGSKRDDEVIAAADEQGVALLVTGVRHFRH